MKYIQKLPSPQFFIDDTQTFTKWDDYDQNDKTKEQRRNLRAYILQNEQNSTCAYCECSITVDSSHIEHIKPKEQYANLTFDYANLIVSCNGQCLKQNIQDKVYYRCGHKKDNTYCEINFLNPTVVSDISDYFEYKEDGSIYESTKDPTKAKYMIKLLVLDEDSLKRAREIAKGAFKKNLKKAIKDYNLDKSKAIEKLLQNHIAFVSFLRFYCKKHYT